MIHPTLLTTADMYKADALTIASGISGIQLMNNAGQAVADEIIRRWSRQKTVVLCGPGNNGGDGFVIARVLSAAGWPVEVSLLGQLSRLTGDAALAAQQWSGAIKALEPEILKEGVLVVDALFGAGLSRDLGGDARALVERINTLDLDCVAVDVPSGVHGDSGEIRGDAPKCRLTVSFFRAKPAHYLLPARDYLGELVIADIGIVDSVLTEIKIDTFVNDPSIWGARFPQPATRAHKFLRGHLLISGGDEMTGAARLAARGARRIGAGLVTVAAAPDIWPLYAADAPGLLVKKVATPEDYRALLEDPRITALIVGPGLGVGQGTRDCVKAALSSGKPVVLDADALSAFARHPAELTELLHSDCVLTPHEGEFARLFDVSGSKLERARHAARETGACLLLKGPDTVIAEPSGAAFLNPTGTPYLATAGSGDVLAGLIGGLLAQGMAGGDAASAAAWMHGRAAEIYGVGLIAEDIPELIPSITQSIIDFSTAKS